MQVRAARLVLGCQRPPRADFCAVFVYSKTSKQTNLQRVLAVLVDGFRAWHLGFADF